LREGEFTLYGLGRGLDPILLVAPVAEQPRLESLKRLEHEYAAPGLSSLRTGRHGRSPLPVATNRMVLVLEDPGGDPLDRLLGRPLEVTQFLRIAIRLAPRSAGCMSET